MSWLVIVLIILTALIIAMVAMLTRPTRVYGGDQDLIIHIAGASGSGKTTLGKQIAAKFCAVVKDIDDLRQEFIHDHYGEKQWTVIDKDAYQKYIDDFIAAQTLPIVFVGLNNMPWWHRDHYYDMHADHKFYIDLGDEEILRRKCTRLLRELPDDTRAMDDLVKNNNKFIKKVTAAVARECSLEESAKMNKKWAADYARFGYMLATSEEILAAVAHILNKN